jgi:OFA family oxalate/formate antiporter-like MFS transporter
MYSDKIGRANAYMLNGTVAALLGLATPWIISTGNVGLLFCAVGIAFWQYGGGLSMLPAFTADFYGTKNLGFNYGLVFLGWGIAFLIPLGAGYLKDMYGNYDLAFQISSAILLVAVVLCKLTKRPKWTTA